MPLGTILAARSQSIQSCRAGPRSSPGERNRPNPRTAPAASLRRPGVVAALSSPAVPRSRDFDLTTALDAAVDLFWSLGYARTSLRDLCEAMDIRPGSFYATFGSKEACFRQVIGRYLQTQLHPLKKSEPAPQNIVEWFRAITTPRRQPKGCLLVLAAVELPHLDEETRRLIRARLSDLRTYFEACLAAGNVPSRRRTPPPSGAALLHAAVLSIHLLARGGAPAAQLCEVANQALQAAGLERLSDRA